MALDIRDQYTTDANLRARQRLWALQQPTFDLMSWVLDLASRREPSADLVLDVGCGNGSYLGELQRRGIDAVGCDLSFGMLDAAKPLPRLCQADAVALPYASASFDLVLAPHMLYHVEDRPTAIVELRRVLEPGHTLVAVTNGANHARALRTLAQRVAGADAPTWALMSTSAREFSLENGEMQLRGAFEHVECVRPKVGPTVRITDPTIVTEYLRSAAAGYEASERGWDEIVDEAEQLVARDVETDGAFVVHGDPGALVCR